MGDLAELRGLITVIAFFSCFVILVGIIPSGFLVASPEYRQIEPPEYFEGVDISAYAQIYNDTVPSFMLTWDLGGYSWVMVYTAGDSIAVGKREFFWIFWTGTTWFNMRNEQGTERGYQVPLTIFDDDFNEEIEQVSYSAHSNVYQNLIFDMQYGFNTTKYDKPSEAFAAGELYFLQGMGIEAISTTINAWNLIGMLLFFQMPEIHPAVNALIAIPMWVCIGYLIYVLILKAIPFVGD